VGSSAGCNPAAFGCGGSTPPVRTRNPRRGCSSTGRAPRLQRGRCRFDSDRLHSLLARLRSVNGKHAPVVRPRCGFDSCRRLLRTLVAQRKSAALRRQRTLVRFQPGVPRGRSSVGRAPERHSGEARSTRVVRLQIRGVTGSTASSNLAGPGSNPGGFAVRPSSRAGVARLPLVRAKLSNQPLRFDTATRPHPTTATSFL
jgi:hypothetical protein